MDDPLKTNDFIKHIIRSRRQDIIGLAMHNRGRLTISKKKSKTAYVFSLFLIMGPYSFLKNVLKVLLHKLKIIFSSIYLTENPTILNFAKDLGIPVKKITNPNNKSFIKYLSNIEVDLIINQSQCIIKEKLLLVPNIGVINRHNALLPRNRGRLTPFWVLYNQDDYTGVSIHFLDEKIDAGKIIVQLKFPVTAKDNFNTIVEKNYYYANKAIILALEKLERHNYSLLDNDAKSATYNSTPTLFHAFSFRKLRIINKVRSYKLKAVK